MVNKNTINEKLQRDLPAEETDEVQEQRTSYRDGRFDFDVTGVKPLPLSDIYYFLIRTPWNWLIGLAFLGYVVVNFFFALLYWLPGDTIKGARPGSFMDAFFFSVQTFSTIGFGGMTPSSVYSNALVTIESFAGLIAVALATGIIFSKFSRPSARVDFSDIMVVHERNGIPCLHFRVANQRKNEIFAMDIRVSVLVQEETAEGHHMRRFRTLRLERDHAPLFTLTWTGIHPIDETSPLYGCCKDSVYERINFILITFQGTDGTFLQTVQARKLYTPDDIKFGERFVDVLETAPDGRITLHHEFLHDSEKM